MNGWLDWSSVGVTSEKWKHQYGALIIDPSGDSKAEFRRQTSVKNTITLRTSEDREEVPNGTSERLSLIYYQTGEYKMHLADLVD